MSEDNSQNISRRKFLGFAGLAGAAVAAGAGLAGCSPSTKSSGSSSTSTSTAAGCGLSDTLVAGNNGLPSFLATPDPIKDIAETKDYDIVIVGAGASGIACAMSAKEAGASSIAVLQKESQAYSAGNTGTGIVLDQTAPGGVETVVSLLLKEHEYRSSREQVEIWARNSGEAVKWMQKLAITAGVPADNAIDNTKKWNSSNATMNGYAIGWFSLDFAPKPYNVNKAVQQIASYEEQQGIEFFYKTPGSQLVVDDSGAVTGIVAEKEDGSYVQFNAKKAVVLATGDYQNDDEMTDYYLPDLHFMGRKKSNCTGDGHKMAIWAGGEMEPIAHTKMLHDFDGGPGAMCDMPFLAVKLDGTRFSNEEAGMSVMNNFLRSEADQGNYAQIMDSDYFDAGTAAGYSSFGTMLPAAALASYMPEETGEKTGVYSDLVTTYKADTIEELGKKLGITDTAAFAKTVQRYNELAAEGADEDFGKQAQYLLPVQTAPFYGMKRHVRVSAIVSGVIVDKNMAVVNADTQEPIKGLYAIGNTAGEFFGGIDYTMKIPGVSLGRAYTEGYVCGKTVAKL